jgi:hypothetical protein
MDQMFLFLGRRETRHMHFCWPNVRFANATREKQSKLQAHSNPSLFHLLYGLIFLWTSLSDYTNLAINQSSGLWSISFPIMLIYVLSNTHSKPPLWLKFSWKISSNSIEFPTLLSWIVIQLLKENFGKNCSGSRVPNWISTWPIILKLMVKLKLSTCAWKHI